MICWSSRALDGRNWPRKTSTSAGWWIRPCNCCNPAPRTARSSGKSARCRKSAATPRCCGKCGPASWTTPSSIRGPAPVRGSRSARAPNRRNTSSTCGTMASASTPASPASSSECSNGCIPEANSRAPESAWPMCAALSPATADELGRKALSARAPRFTSRCHGLQKPSPRAFDGEHSPTGGMNSVLHILHLEDDPADARLVSLALRDEGLKAHITMVADRPALIAALNRGGYDLILADYKLPGFGGLEALELWRAQWPAKPFLFVTGSMGEDLAVESLKRGATDYILKDNLARLVPAIHRAVEEAETQAQRQQVQAALREGREAL